MAPAYGRLRALLQRVEARALDVAEPPLQARGAVEAGPARQLHRQLDGADRPARPPGTGRSSPRSRSRPRIVVLNRRDHGGVPELCRRAAPSPSGRRGHKNARPGGPAARKIEREVARALGHAEVDGVDQRERDGGDDLEEGRDRPDVCVARSMMRRARPSFSGTTKPSGRWACTGSARPTRLADKAGADVAAEGLG